MKTQTQENDFFDNHENLPQNVAEILNEMGESPTYTQLEDALKKLEQFGYTFEYGLDAMPYDLRKITDFEKLQKANNALETIQSILKGWEEVAPNKFANEIEYINNILKLTK